MRKREPDFNQNAARIVSQSAGENPRPVAPEIEAAWQEWSKGIQKVDERGMALLRAAFEAGAETARKLCR